MLNPAKTPEPASPESSRQTQQTLRALQTDMRGADDGKIRQIVSLSEASAENPVWHTVLQALRPRLAVLRPTRSLRFTRLLFMPLDDLLVPARHWRPGQATVPRTSLQVISNTVRSGLGGDIAGIERLIAGRNTSEPEVVTQAGLALWGPAAEILAQAPPPDDWPQTGLPVAVYAPLAKAIATVLRRGSAIGHVLREAEVGMLELTEQSFADIIAGMEGEPPEGCAMVFTLILRQLPDAAALMRRLTEAQRSPAQKMSLQAAMDRGLEDVLGALESESDLTRGLSEGALLDVGSQVTRIAALLRDLGDDPGAVRHRPRLRSIRDKLDTLCRARFADGMKTGLAEPLAQTSAPVDSAGQKQLESCARDLRTVETAGRKLGSSATYDALLQAAEATVEVAAQGGNLSPMRAIRLVEILSGAEAAEKMYKRTIGQ
jgi:hypothetical protein